MGLREGDGHPGPRQDGGPGELTGAASVSDALDIALDTLISQEQLRRDLAAYRSVPQTSEELQLAEQTGHVDLDDETDWEQLCADVE